MPIRAFWCMSGNINRIKAEEDVRGLTLGTAIQSGKEAIQEHRNQLIIEIGTVTIVEDKLDREGLERLKLLS